MNSTNEQLERIFRYKNDFNRQNVVDEACLAFEKESLEQLRNGLAADEVCNYLSLELDKLSYIDQFQNQMSSEEYLSNRDLHAESDFFEGIENLLKKIPDSNGSKYYSRFDVNIGIVADEFLYRSLEGAANLIYITADNYKEYIDKLDVFIVVTTWKGLDKEWTGLGNPNRLDMRKLLKKIIDTYKSKDIKVVFYSKEDPVNYDIFIEIAKLCDYVFTTAIEVVPQYKLDCQTEKVSVLPFGIEPCYHNPIGMRVFKKKNEVLFAGSCYKKYPHRTLDMEIIFDGVLAAGCSLKILDRNYQLRDERYFFPAKYIPFLSPAVNHADLQKLHKLYDWAINFNSVKNSSSMMANRVYELQALGNIVLSNDSVAIKKIFPNVFIINKQSQAMEILADFSEDSIYQHQLYGIRRMMNSETSFHRMHQLLNFIDIPVQPVSRKVCVVINHLNDSCQKMFDQQVYPEKELILLKDFSEEIKAQFDLVAFFDENSHYGEHYLEDMINAFKYTNSDYVTKSAYFKSDNLVEGTEHNYVEMIGSKYRTVFWSASFSCEELANLRNEKFCMNGYSIDHFEYSE